MENVIQHENKMIKSLMLGINLVGTIFLNVLVVFIVTYFFDVDNFFTNGGLKNLNPTARVMHLSMITSIWMILLVVNYRMAKKYGVFTLSFNKNKTLYYCIPLAVALPFLFNMLLGYSVNFTVIEQYQFILEKCSQNEPLALFITSLNYLYWFVELLIVIMIISLFHNFGSHLKFVKWIPWGGLGLALTWGLEQLLMRPNTYLHIFLMSFIAGILYQLSKRNFFVVLVYFVILILLKGL